MTIEIVIVLMTAILAVLAYIAKALHNMDRNLAVAIEKGNAHDKRIEDHEDRIRNIESVL